MAQSLNLYTEKDLNLEFINKTVIRLEKVLEKNDIYNKSEFKEWLHDFRKIYGNTQTNLQLYIASSLIYFIGHSFILRFILRVDDPSLDPRIKLKSISELEKKIISHYNSPNNYELTYFNPLIYLAEKEDLNFFNELIRILSEYIFNLKIGPEFFFDFLIQKIISPIVRHKSGEYYTPPFLVRKMVEECYSFGQSILDPCCGSGNFLIEVVKSIMSHNKSKNEKIAAIKNVYGFDINPISIYISKINLFYLIKDSFPGVKLNLHVFDSLFQTRQEFYRNFDLIIANPPWYTYRDIESIESQEKVKKLAEELEIKPLPKNLLNLEISTLFFVKSMRTFMKSHAKIFFIITKGVITGSHASRFRNFKELSKVKVWLFDKKIEKIFNIDFICLSAQKSEGIKNSRSEIKAYYYTLTGKKGTIDYYDNLTLQLKKRETLIPYSIEKKAGKTYTKKLISRQSQKNLIPLKESYYKTLFHKGADLNPRNLIFIKSAKVNDTLVKINPDDRIFKRAKSPWNKKEFENRIVEKKYLFKVVKSTELVKFFIFDHYNVFLPLSKSDLSFKYENLAKNAKNFYDEINELYLKYKKDTTKHCSLMENLDRWSKLINQRQMSKIKVVYNNSGSILSSTVVQGDFLITGDLTFYETDNLEKAFYLSAILNSDLMTHQIKILKSSRHIFKLPFEIPIKKFDGKSIAHKKLALLGAKAQNMVKANVNEIFEKKTNEISKYRIQNILKVKLKNILTQIDEILFKEFNIRKS